MPALTEEMGGKVKPAGYKQDFTPWQMKEIFRCSQDIIYFSKKYVMIQHPTRGAMKFDLWDFQEDLLRMYQGERLTISLLSRQVGKCCDTSTLILVNKEKRTIGSLFSVTYKKRIVNWLNEILVRLAQYAATR